jgi:hypothetical protein
MKKLDLLTGVLAFAAMSSKFVDSDRFTPFDPESIKEKVKPIPSNHQEFIINGVSIWALNKKNAYRRYKNMIYKQTVNS